MCAAMEYPTILSEHADPAGLTAVVAVYRRRAAAFIVISDIAAYDPTVVAEVCR